MQEIPLTQKKISRVDDADYVWLTQWRWRASVERRRDGSIRTWYARCDIRGDDGRYHTQYMHRMLLIRWGICKSNDHRVSDHKDGDGCNNQRYNLRLGTPTQNGRNQRKQPRTTNRYKGVTRSKTQGKWEAQIKVNGRRLHLGTFGTQKVAAQAYDTAARAYFGEFACLNFAENP